MSTLIAIILTTCATGTIAAASPTWVLAQNRQSCSAACSGAGLVCTANSEEKMYQAGVSPATIREHLGDQFGALCPHGSWESTPDGAPMRFNGRQCEPGSKRSRNTCARVPSHPQIQYVCYCEAPPPPPPPPATFQGCWDYEENGTPAGWQRWCCLGQGGVDRRCSENSHPVTSGAYYHTCGRIRGSYEARVTQCAQVCRETDPSYKYFAIHDQTACFCNIHAPTSSANAKLEGESTCTTNNVYGLPERLPDRSAYPEIHVAGWSSSNGASFLRVTVETPGSVDFTTLRLALQTDAVLDTSGTRAAQFIQSDGLYPLGGSSTTAFSKGADDWAGYSVALSQSDSAFAIVLATDTARTAPAEFYLLLTGPASYARVDPTEDIQLADGNLPAGLMPIPTLISSVGAPSPPSPPPPAAPPSPPPLFTCRFDGDEKECNGEGGACYRSEQETQSLFHAADLTNLLKVYAGDDNGFDLHFFRTCGDYDDDKKLAANDITNMIKYFNGNLAMAPHLASGDATQRPRASGVR